MEGLLGVGGAIALCVVTAIYLLRGRRVDEADSSVDDIDTDHQLIKYLSSARAPIADSKPRLTELQSVALVSATIETIYIEGESHHTAAAHESEAYPKRTIESLVKRGLLEPATGGGFRATPQGQAASVG
ncbi:hypothetical protein ABE459_16450 [Pseudomonas sp. TWI923]|uniref:hypothetical protein n=1 Tax=Pseudomonas sp. TWI923 TaxID=3136794 RepID=UPI00320A8F3F